MLVLTDYNCIGEIIIRPSSKGANFLAITWAFQTDWFKHIDIEERGKLNPSDTTSLGTSNAYIINFYALTIDVSIKGRSYTYVRQTTT